MTEPNNIMQRPMMIVEQQQRNGKTDYVEKNMEGKDNGPVKPKQPLSAYNLFFQVERRRIIKGIDHIELRITSEELQSIVTDHKSQPKRQHRRSHGKVGFKDLARTIAGRWKQVRSELKDIFHKQAIIEKEEYVKNLAVWKAFKKEQDEKLENMASSSVNQEAARRTIQPETTSKNPQGGEPSRPCFSFSETKSSSIFQDVFMSQQQPLMQLRQLHDLRNQVQGELSRLTKMSSPTPLTPPPAASPIKMIVGRSDCSSTSAFLERQQEQQILHYQHQLIDLAPSLQVIGSAIEALRGLQQLSLPKPAHPTLNNNKAVSPGPSLPTPQNKLLNPAAIVGGRVTDRLHHLPQSNNHSNNRSFIVKGCIFHQARQGGYDLFETMDSQDMDQLFID